MLCKIDDKKIWIYLFENNLTVKDFALKCDLSRSTIQDIFDGHKVRIPTVAKISDALGIKVEELILK